MSTYSPDSLLPSIRRGDHSPEFGNTVWCLGDYAHLYWFGNWALLMGGLADLFAFRGRDSGGRNVGPGEGREKMNEAIGTSNPWKTTAKVLVAVLVLLVMALVSMLQPAPSTEGSSSRRTPWRSRDECRWTGLRRGILTSSATPKWLQATNRATLAEFPTTREGRRGGRAHYRLPRFFPETSAATRRRTR